MAEQVPIAVSASVDNSLSSASDPITSLVTALDVARNQFRARRFEETFSNLAQLMQKCEALRTSATGITPEEMARIMVILACALTLDGRCRQEQGESDESLKPVWDRAVAIFKEHIDNSKPRGDWLGYYGAAVRLSGDSRGSIPLLQRVIDMSEAVPETYRHLGLALLEQPGFTEEAVSHLQRAVELAPADIPSLRGLGEAWEKLEDKKQAARAYRELALALAVTGRSAEALTAASKSVELDDSDPVALRYRADLLRGARRFAESLQMIDRALELNADDPDSWASKGAVLDCLGRLPEALEALDRTLQMRPGEPWVLAVKGEVLNGLKRYPEAEAALREAIRLRPNVASYYAALGLVLGASGKVQEALDTARRCLGLDPHNFLGLVVRGRALIDLREFAQALESYDQALAIEPRSTYAWTGKVDALEDLGRNDAALAALDMILDIDPRDAGAMVKKARLLCELADPARYAEVLELTHTASKLHPNAAAVAEIVDIASTLLSRGLPEEALSAANAALSVECAPTLALFVKGDALQRLGRHTEAQSALEEASRHAPEAEKALREFIRQNPRMDWTWRAQARLLLSLNRPQEALVAADKSLELSPHNVLTVDFKVKALLALNQQDAAIACLQDAAGWENSPLWVYEQLVSLLEKKGRNEEALQALDTYIVREPQSHWANAERGYVLHSLNRTKDAEVELLRAAKFEGADAWVFAELASVARELDNPRGALDAITQALKKDENYAAAHEIKGQILISIGQNEAALQSFDRAIELKAVPYFWKAMALDYLERIEPAREFYSKTDDPWSLRGLADMSILLGEVDKGQQIFKDILGRMASQPQGPYEIGLCAWCNYGVGNLDLSIRLYSQAISLDQRALRAGQFDRAMIIACAGRYTLAKRQYDSAIEAAHDADPWLQRNLFWTAIVDLKRAMDKRYPEIAKAEEVRKCLERLQSEYDRISNAPDQPPLSEIPASAPSSAEDSDRPGLPSEARTESPNS